MRIFGNVGYKVLAVVITLFLWVVARGSSSVERGFDIPVVLEGVPDELVVVDRGADVINVRLLGTRAALRNFDPQRLEYPLEISEAKPGQADFEVDLSRFDLPRGARVVSRSPSRIELSFEKRAGKTVKVKPDVEGAPADGYKLGRVSVNPRGSASRALAPRYYGSRRSRPKRSTWRAPRSPSSGKCGSRPGPGHVWADSPRTVKVTVDVEAERTPLAPTKPPAAGAEREAEAHPARAIRRRSPGSSAFHAGRELLRRRARRGDGARALRHRRGARSRQRRSDDRRDGARARPGGERGLQAPRRRAPQDHHRQGHAPLGLHVRERARRGHLLDGRRRAPGRPDADARHGVPHRRHALRRRRDDLRQPQPVHRQRHQVLLPRRLQAARRVRAAHRGADRQRPSSRRCARRRKKSVAPSASRTRPDATSCSSRRPFRRS